MICYILALVLLVNLIYHLQTTRRFKQVSIILLSFSLLTGHLWIYPSTTSQSWDSSLAYINYYRIEEAMELYIDSIPLQHKDIGTRIRLNARNHASLISLKKYLGSRRTST